MRKTIYNIRAAIFDLDGTLFDSVGLWHDIDDIFLSKRGIVPDAEYKRRIATLGFKGAADFTIDYYGLDDTPEQLIGEWDELARDEYAHTVRIFDGVKGYLAECKAAGIKIAAVTSLHRDFAEPCMKNNGIREYFSHIFIADETGYDKSSPDIYLYAAKTLGVNSRECVVFDDVPVAIIAAKQAGMTTVAVASAMSNVKESEDYTDYFVNDLSEAPELCNKKV